MVALLTRGQWQPRIYCHLASIPPFGPVGVSRKKQLLDAAGGQRRQVRGVRRCGSNTPISRALCVGNARWSTRREQSFGACRCSRRVQITVSTLNVQPSPSRAASAAMSMAINTISMTVASSPIAASGSLVASLRIARSGAVEPQAVEHVASDMFVGAIFRPKGDASHEPRPDRLRKGESVVVAYFA